MKKGDGERHKKLEEEGSKICFLGNFPPVECGIATFTKDLSYALNKKFNPKLKSRIIALNESTGVYNYSSKVIMQLNRDYIEDYIEIAKKINKSRKIKLICIQHEFGIFGGDYGSYLVPFLETIEKPVVVTFHSILPNPDEMRKKLVRFICDKSSAVIVMAKKAVEVLNQNYGIDARKISVIYHGIPNVSLRPQEQFKRKLRLDGKIVLSTFGLLSRGKGIEYMIRSLPPLIKKYPNLVYLIIGETHPMVRKKEGEQYRNELVGEVEKLGLKDHVKFYNKYLTLQEIIDYLRATDIYICTNLDENQIVSGTLSYALGCGRAVISTPNVYAKELLEEKRGILVKFKNPDSYSEAIERVLSNEELKEDMEKRAYSFGRSMIWSNVSAEYLNVFNKIVKLREEVTEKYPKIKLDHFRRLTDGIGLMQFSKNFIPDASSGYTVDDNARALIVSILHHHLFKSVSSLELTRVYLSFLEQTQDEKGKFRNIIENKKIPCSEDALGRAIWALGYVTNKSRDTEITERSKILFEKSYKKIARLISPRAKAFSIGGLYYYFKRYRDKVILNKIKKLADSLVKSYKEGASNDWQWFEKYLTYSNSKLPEALFLAYELTKDKKYLNVAEKTLSFLSNIVFIEGSLYPIGQNGWYNRYGERAFFDQQPIDASCMVQTYLAAYNATKKEEYYDKAVLSFNWFLGKNHLKQMIYDESTGGCYDGLSRNSVNLNQGAESTISYLIARLFLEEIRINNKIFKG